MKEVCQLLGLIPHGVKELVDSLVGYPVTSRNWLSYGNQRLTVLYSFIHCIPQGVQHLAVWQLDFSAQGTWRDGERTQWDDITWETHNVSVQAHAHTHYVAKFTNVKMSKTCLYHTYSKCILFSLTLSQHSHPPLQMEKV